MQANGKIVLAGAANGDFALARYNSDGTLDGTFGSGGKVTTDLGSASDGAAKLALQSDGKIVVGGTNQSENFVIVRYAADGSLDTGFGSGGVVTTDFNGDNDYLRSVAVRSDGSIFAAGEAEVGGDIRFAVARYGVDGTLDTKLTTAFAGTDDAVAWDMTLAPDGDIVVAGNAYTSSSSSIALARYEAPTGTPGEDLIVDVMNVAPTVEISGPTSGTVGNEVTFTSSVTDPSADDAAAGFDYSWSVTRDGNAFASGTQANISFTPTQAGSYVVTLAATDKDGGTGNSAPATLTVAGVTLPTVTIIATNDTATEAGPTTATFTVTRSGSTSGTLEVFFEVDAANTTAETGDYQSLGTSVTIQDTQSTATITLTPQQEADADDEIITLKLTDAAAYDLGNPFAADATIIDDDGTGVPDAPTNLTAMAVEGVNIYLRWQDNSNDEQGFQIQRSTDPGFPNNPAVTSSIFLAPNPTATADFLDGAVQAEVTYYYRVLAHNLAGNSVYSNVASDTTLPPDGFIEPQVAPSAPTGAAANVANSTQVDLDWDENPEQGAIYTVYRSTDANFEPNSFTFVNNVVRSDYVDSDLVPGLTYYYKITADLVGVESAATGPLAVDTTQIPTPPQAPSDLAPRGTYSDMIELGWTDNSNNEVGFIVQRLGQDQSWQTLGQVPANVTTFIDTDPALQPSTTYQYLVFAVNGDSTSLALGPASGGSSTTSTSPATTQAAGSETPPIWFATGTRRDRTGTLSVAKWEHAFPGTQPATAPSTGPTTGPALAPNFIELDPDRFYVQYRGPWGLGTVLAQISTATPGGDPDYTQGEFTIVLTETWQPGIYESNSTILVSNWSDDQEAGNRTLRIGLGGTVTARVDQQLATASVPVRKTVHVHAVFLKDVNGVILAGEPFSDGDRDGQRDESEAFVDLDNDGLYSIRLNNNAAQKRAEYDVKYANEQLAQVGIKLDPPVVHIRRAASALNQNANLDDGVFNLRSNWVTGNNTISNPVTTVADFTLDEQAIFQSADVLNTPENDDWEVFYVDKIKRANEDIFRRGHTFQRPFYVGFQNSAVPSVNVTSIISSAATLYTAAHEAVRAITQTPTLFSPTNSTNIMRIPTTPVAKEIETTIFDTKRLWGDIVIANHTKSQEDALYDDPMGLLH